jgi:hypothetical protein
MKVKRLFSPRRPAAVHVLTRRIYGDSAFKRSTTTRRLRVIAKARGTAA